MRPLALIIAAVSFVVTASIALAVIRHLGIGDVPLAFVVGAIVGTQAGAIMHAREPDARPTAIPKLILGAVLAAVAIGFGAAVHFGLGRLSYPEITLPISAVGSFVFPFVLFNQMFNAMRNSRKRDG